MASVITSAALDFPGRNPGKARAEFKGERWLIGNNAVSVAWSLKGAKLTPVEMRNYLAGETMPLTGEVFQIVLADGARYPATALLPDGQAAVAELKTDQRSSRLAGRIPGCQLVVPLRSADGSLRVIWRAQMRDGANYVRQEIELNAPAKDLAISEISWFDQALPGATTAGRVDGSPVVAGDFFLGFEDPMAINAVGASARIVGKNEPTGASNCVTCRLQRDATLSKGEQLTQSFVAGVAPKGQMRRAFLYYLERERGHPYRSFLHYNTWYDISPWRDANWNPYAMNETNSLDAIRTFGERFIKPHGVVMDSMVFDDGWNDVDSVWEFHPGFPNGFTPLAELCRGYGTSLGVWLSPRGGAGKALERRKASASLRGYETNAAGFSMAGPKYYAGFKAVCLDMIRKYGVNHFKLDGIARGTRASGSGKAFILDTEALRRLMLELRQEDQDLFINFTTGSWPSPFWLRYADSVWRQAWDTGARGKGPAQQRGLTYRDSEVYKNIVQRAPLYPLSSLMTGGITYSRHGRPSDPTYNSAGLKDDIRSYFGSGTGLQELYIQPSRLTTNDWSVLAEAAKWSRANQDVLVDTHWIGGDPAKSQVYGWASWNPRKGIVTLRNPDNRPREFVLDVETAFELPAHATKKFRLRSPWAEDALKPEFRAEAGKPARLELEAFGIIVLEATPSP